MNEVVKWNCQDGRNKSVYYGGRGLTRHSSIYCFVLFLFSLFAILNISVDENLDLPLQTAP